MRKEDRTLRTAVDRAIRRLVEEKKVEEILARYGIPVLGESLVTTHPEGVSQGR